MTWWAALPATLATLVAFWAPGAALLAVVGFRGLLLAALAPAVTAAVFGVASVAAGAIGLAWGWLPALVLTVALGAGLWFVRARLADRCPGAARPFAQVRHVPLPRRWLLPATVLAAVAAQLVPVAVGMGRPDRVQNAWDALFHLAALGQVREGGGAGPWAFGELLGPHWYPYAWHAVAGLVPAWGGPVVVTAVAAFVPCALATAVGVAAAGRALFRDDRAAAGATAMVGCGVALPLAVALQPGLIPNAFGLALLPGLLALTVELTRGDTKPEARAAGALLAAAVGIALVHPGAATALGVIALPWLAPALLRAARHVWARPRLRVLAAVLVLATGSGIAAVLTSPTYRVVARIRMKEPPALGTLVADLATGNLGEWSGQAILPTALAIGGVVALGRRRDGRPLVIALALALLAYVAAASTWEPLAQLTTPWYRETRRLAPVVGLLVAIVAGWALMAGARWLAGRLGATNRRSVGVAGPVVAGPALVPSALVLSALVLSAAPAAATVAALSTDTFSQDMADAPQDLDRKPYLTEDEEALLARLAEHLDPTALMLGSSLSGAGHLAALTGQRVQQPYHAIPIDDRARYVSDHLGALGTDPGVCAVVRELDARYVYVDPYPMHSTYWTTAYRGTFTQPPPLDPLDAADTGAAVYSLDVCYPTGSSARDM